MKDKKSTSSMSNKRYKWIIFSLGIIIGLLVFFNTLPTLISDITMEVWDFIIGFIILPLWTVAPYFIAGFIAYKIRYPWIMLIISILLFSFSLWASIQIFYFSKSSTAVVGLVFIPFWSILLIFIVWAIYGIIRLISRKFSI